MKQVQFLNTLPHGVFRLPPDKRLSVNISRMAVLASQRAFIVFRYKKYCLFNIFYCDFPYRQDGEQTGNPVWLPKSGRQTGVLLRRFFEDFIDDSRG